MTPQPATTARRARHAIQAAGGIALAQDIAIVLELSIARAHQLVAKTTFPEPVGRTPSGRPVWAVNEILAWNQQRQHALRATLTLGGDTDG